MGAEAIKLPVIDFSSQDLKPGTPIWDSVKVQVTKALEEFGCFEVLYDKVPRQLRKALFDILAELFDLPLETKLTNSSEKPFHGYLGQNPHMPLHESMTIENPTLLEKVESFTNQMCPQGNSNVSKTMHYYSEQLSVLDLKVRRMVLESLGLEKYMDEHMNSTVYNLRLMKYKGPQTDEIKVGQSIHKDKDFVTILHEINPVRGLEVLTKDDQWIKVNFSPDSFIVIIGESFHAWTNGRLHPPYHRVMMSGNESRYTIGLFVKPKAGYVIKAPEELVDQKHPPLYKPYEYMDFLAFCASEAGLNGQATVKEYCGV